MVEQYIGSGHDAYNAKRALRYSNGVLDFSASMIPTLPGKYKDIIAEILDQAQEGDQSHFGAGINYNIGSNYKNHGTYFRDWHGYYNYDSNFFERVDGFSENLVQCTKKQILEYLTTKPLTEKYFKLNYDLYDQTSPVKLEFQHGLTHGLIAQDVIYNFVRKNEIFDSSLMSYHVLCSICQLYPRYFEYWDSDYKDMRRMYLIAILGDDNDAHKRKKIPTGVPGLALV